MVKLSDFIGLSVFVRNILIFLNNLFLVDIYGINESNFDFVLNVTAEHKHNAE